MQWKSDDMATTYDEAAEICQSWGGHLLTDIAATKIEHKFKKAYKKAERKIKK